MPVFHSPENLAFALSRFHAYHEWRESRAEAGFGVASEITKGQLNAADTLGAGAAMSEYDAKQLLREWDIPTAEERLAHTEDEAAESALEIGYPVALKVNSPRHSAQDGGGRSETRHRRRIRTPRRIPRDHGQRRRIRARRATGRRAGIRDGVRRGTEVIVGVNYDAQLGPVLLYGMGGVLVEVMRDVALRVCPVSRLDAEEMVAQVRGSQMLRGFRGGPKADVAALVDTLVRVSEFAVHLEGKIAELDINPLAVMSEGEGVKALDALILTQGRKG